MDAIIGSSLMSAQCAHDSEHGVVCVWSSGAEEQIEAIIAAQNRAAHDPGPPGIPGPAGCIDEGAEWCPHCGNIPLGMHAPWCPEHYEDEDGDEEE
jgi:hypothetical protein